MKRINLFLSLIVILGAGLLFSCGKGGKSPVDQYVEILDQATEKAEKISSMADVLNVQQIISTEETTKLLKDNADYELTDKDKEKLKKSYDKLLKVAYNKTTEYSGIPDSMKKQTDGQLELIIEAANKVIDNAHTLSDLDGLR